MSTSNIISIETIMQEPRVVQVIFRTHGGSGIRIYEYKGSDARAIENGADPADYHGTRVV